MPGSPPTVLGFGNGFSGVTLGVEYGTSCPGVKRVMEMANVDCSGFPEPESGILGAGTGIKEAMRDARDWRWIEYSEMGPLGVCMLTASPLKHGMTGVGEVDRNVVSKKEGESQPSRGRSIVDCLCEGK